MENVAPSLVSPQPGPPSPPVLGNRDSNTDDRRQTPSSWPSMTDSASSLPVMLLWIRRGKGVLRPQPLTVIVTDVDISRNTSVVGKMSIGVGPSFFSYYSSSHWIFKYSGIRQAIHSSIS